MMQVGFLEPNSKVADRTLAVVQPGVVDLVSVERLCEGLGHGVALWRGAAATAIWTYWGHFVSQQSRLAVVAASHAGDRLPHRSWQARSLKSQAHQHRSYSPHAPPHSFGLLPRSATTSALQVVKAQTCRELGVAVRSPPLK
jgi:hypothetical protein